jgi:signal transduction histidine kinase/ActR/RegA family two-component response regulator
LAQVDGLTDRILDHLVDLTRDHQQLLQDLGARLEPHLGELASVSDKAVRETAMGQALAPGMETSSFQEEAVRVIFGGLRKGNMRQYFAGLSEWVAQNARSGVTYDQLLVMVREYWHCSLPFIRQDYGTGPELELVLGSLDDVYTGIVTLMGAVYIQAVQAQLIHSARMRALGQLAGGAAHSFNNMLTAILGRTQLLLQRIRDPEWITDLEDIQRSVIIGAQAVRRLQDFARIQPDEPLVEADVNALVRDAAEITRFMWRDEAELNGIVVDVVKDLAEVPAVQARPNQLREAFVALILNAVEGMPRGGSITLRTERKGDDVLVTVTDTGDGMPEATHSRVFEPFFTTKGIAHVGLGLTTVTRIVEQHKGSLTVDSEPGRGSSFTIAIPAAPEVVQSKPEPMLASVRPARILIIDDDAAVREITGKFLSIRGYQVTVVGTGSEGISSFKRSGFDLVVTDLGMPGMSGWEVAHAIKRLNAKTLVVLMTGWATSLDEEKVKESGIDRIIHKPFQVDEVLALVNEAVELRDKM